MNNIEILAPAGSYQSLVAAINASCDAVYIGGSRFGARAFAENLSEEDMLRAIDYTHIHDKKIYLTVNTLLKNEEIKQELYEYLVKFYEIGLDAVIVQDIGVLSFIHRNFPDLPIHASTQMSLTMSKGLNLLKQYGVTRIVTSRELTLEEIRSIKDETDLEIESFVHGALCYCYSGQCLMSSMLGGRSGNRGRCAQPCRMPYQFLDQGRVISNEKEPYLLSPKDISTLELIPEIIEAGVYSFKIEGRMKRPEYAALTSFLYRKYVDLYFKLGKEGYKNYIKDNTKEMTDDIRHLSDLYNRGDFTKGYYLMKNGTSMMSMNRPNHSGVLVGKVTDIKGIRAKIKLSEVVNAQDVLEFRSKNGENKYDFTVKDDNQKGSILEANFKNGSGIQIGDYVFRTKNQKLLDEIGTSFLQDERKVPITGYFKAHVGKPVTLCVTCRNIEAIATGDKVDKAEKQPVTEEKIRTQLNKTNTTSFVFEELTVEMDDNIFLPVGKLNELRREALEQLILQITQTYRRTASGEKKMERSVNMDKNNKGNHYSFSHEKSSVSDCVNKDLARIDNKLGICVTVGTLHQLKTALQFEDIERIYLRMEDLDLEQLNEVLELVTNHKIALYLMMPAVFRKSSYDMWEAAINNGTVSLGEQRLSGFIIKNLEEYEFVNAQLNRLKIQKEIILDNNLYIMNQEAKGFWQNLGITQFTAPFELNRQELTELGCEDFDLVAYGQIPVMISTQCSVKNTVGCTNQIKTYTLKDRYQKEFVVVNHCKYCYNTIYNSLPLSLLNVSDEVKRLCPKRIRLDFTVETEEKMKQILKNYIDVFRYNRKMDTEVIKDYTKGHFNRGIE